MCSWSGFVEFENPTTQQSGNPNDAYISKRKQSNIVNGMNWNIVFMNSQWKSWKIFAFNHSDMTFKRSMHKYQRAQQSCNSVCYKWEAIMKLD